MKTAAEIYERLRANVARPSGLPESELELHLRAVAVCCIKAAYGPHVLEPDEDALDRVIPAGLATRTNGG